MKILIDIPDELYQSVLDGTYCGSLYQELKNGERVVTCKECKYSHMTYDGKCKYCDKLRDEDGNFETLYFDGDEWCGFGERKEDG